MQIRIRRMQYISTISRERSIILREEYSKAVLEIISFKSDDVIVTSGCETGGNNTPEDNL